MTDEEIRRTCGRISQLLGLAYDESEQTHFSKVDLYDIIKWHSGGKRPRGERAAYSRFGLEQKVCEELGIDRRSSTPHFIIEEYETMLTVIENSIEEEVEAVQAAKDDAGFLKASELAGGADDE